MKGIIAWFAENHVAANLLMVFVIVSGLLAVPTIKQTIFPDIDIPYISITVPYPGASPEEVEKSVTIRIEEKVSDIEGIQEVRSSSNEGAANVTLKLTEDADMGRTLDEVQTRVDSIVSFPEEIEKPQITEILFRTQVLDIAVHGAADERSLKVIGQRIRDEIAALPGITQVELVSARPYEISIEVSEASLQRHGLRFDDVVFAVQRTSLDMPGGSVKTQGGEILLRTAGQAYRGHEFERIPLVTRTDGSRVQISDVARVVDGFTEDDRHSLFDGDPAVFVLVNRVGSQSALEVAETVKAYIERERETLPSGIQITIWDDDSLFLRDRIGMMLRNAFTGFILVVLMLAIFLKLRVAIWVAIGVPVSVAGALALMPVMGLDINILTVFAFIMALGILVDDAIVTGENIYTHLERDDSDPLRCAIEGTNEVATPVIFGILTTIAAFAPFAFVGGDARIMATSLAGVMIGCLVFSLIESKLVLPSHLAHASGSGQVPRTRIGTGWARFQRRVSDGLAHVVDHGYRPAVERCIEWRYFTLSLGAAAFLICVALVTSGAMKMHMMPPMQADNIWARVTMPLGTPVETTERAVAQIESGVERLRHELDASRKEDEESAVRHVLTTIGAHSGSSPIDRPGDTGRSHLGQVTIELIPSEARKLTTTEIAGRLRDLVGPIPGAEEIQFIGQFRHFGEPIDLELRGDDMQELLLAGDELKFTLEQYPGVHDVNDSFREGKQELKLKILPGAESLGLSLSDLGRQVRQAFYGAEVQRIQRGRDEVKVMVRFPRSERRSLSDVQSMRIRLPDGTAVPFSAVAEAELGRGYASIFRRERMRSVNVRAAIEEGKANANEIVKDIVDNHLPKILAMHPGVTYALAGEQREQSAALSGLLIGAIISLLLIFILLAVPLRSYVQPIIIMGAIPFGFVGAIVGHGVMGYELSFLSLTGVVACAGVVVNDSLVLVTFMNRLRDGGMELAEAAAQAGCTRFRAIMLTSITTFAGLTPIMLEKSVQAQMVIPMAVSLGFGVMIATIFTLLLIPATVIILDDVRQLSSSLWGRLRPNFPEPGTPRI
jgi:multidrug efflux pump subunit AcrB